jgi:hypothetical protein
MLSRTIQLRLQPGLGHRSPITRYDNIFGLQPRNFHDTNSDCVSERWDVRTLYGGPRTHNSFDEISRCQNEVDMIFKAEKVRVDQKIQADLKKLNRYKVNKLREGIQS